MTMRNAVVAVLVLTVGMSCSAQRFSGKARPAVEPGNLGELGRPNYTITLTPPSGPTSLQSPLLIEMYYTNITNADIYMNVVICSTCVGQRIMLTKDGKEVDTSAFQRLSTGRGLPSDASSFPPSHGNSRTLRYPPGVFWKVNLDLRKLYIISEPGEYKVTATRTEETASGKVAVTSNTATLDIVP